MPEISYRIEPDQFGVFDGKQLAAALIADAWKLLASYAEGCPACTDTLFSYLANRELEELHQAKPQSIVMALPGVTDEGRQKHFLTHAPQTQAWLEKQWQMSGGGDGCEPSGLPPDLA